MNYSGSGTFDDYNFGSILSIWGAAVYNIQNSNVFSGRSAQKTPKTSFLCGKRNEISQKNIKLSDLFNEQELLERDALEQLTRAWTSR